MNDLYADKLREESDYEAFDKRTKESFGLYNEFKPDPKLVKNELKHTERVNALRKEVDELDVFVTTNSLEPRQKIEIFEKQISLLRQLKKLGY